MAENVQDGDAPGRVVVTPEDIGRFMRAMMESAGNFPPPAPRAAPAAQGRASLLISFIKMNPPVFKGDSNPQVAEAWLMQVSKLLEALDVQNDQDKIALVVVQLVEEANHW